MLSRGLSMNLCVDGWMWLAGGMWLEGSTRLEMHSNMQCICFLPPTSETLNICYTEAPEHIQWTILWEAKQCCHFHATISVLLSPAVNTNSLLAKTNQGPRKRQKKKKHPAGRKFCTFSKYRQTATSHQRGVHPPSSPSHRALIQCTKASTVGGFPLHFPSWTHTKEIHFSCF